MSWGSDTNDESKPNWRHLTKPANAPLSSNVFATAGGWAIRRPWGDEIIVAIGGLTTNLGVPTMVAVELVTLTVDNVTPSNVAFRLLFNEAVTVNGAPTLVALGTGNTANVSLVYNAGLSDPSAGKLVFANATATLAGGINTDTLVVNSTSVFAGQLVLDAVSGLATTNTVVGSNTVTLS